MATASSVSSEQVLTDINEQILLCAICMERFKSPKILPCYHTYCEPCLTEWVKTNNGQLICPTCKELFPLPSGGVSAIDNNRFINDLQQILSDVTPNSEKSLCDICEKEAKFWCQDCGEFYCDDCVKQHKRMRLSKDHKLMTVDEYTEKMSSEHFRLIQPRFCDKHHSTQLEFFCDSCQVPTCYKCTVVEHVPPEHKTISVEAALEKYMPTMKEFEEKAAQKVSDFKQARDGVLDVGKCLEKNKTIAESQIKDLSETVIVDIKKQENRLLNEVADTYSPKRKQIDSKVEQLEHRLVGAESMHSHLNHLLRYGGAVDIMAAKNEIRLRLQQDDLTQEGSDDIDSNIVFTENPPCRLVDLGCVGSKVIHSDVELLEVMGTVVLGNLPVSVDTTNIERLIEKDLKIKRVRKDKDEVLLVKGNLQSVIKTNERLALMMANQGDESASMATCNQTKTYTVGMRTELDKLKGDDFSPSQDGDVLQNVSEKGPSEGTQSSFNETPAESIMIDLKKKSTFPNNVKSVNPLEHTKFKKDNQEEKNNNQESGLSKCGEIINEEHGTAAGANGRVIVSSEGMTSQLKEGRQVQLPLISGKQMESPKTTNDSHVQIDSQNPPKHVSKCEKPHNAKNQYATAPVSNIFSDLDRKAKGQEKNENDSSTPSGSDILDSIYPKNGQHLDLHEDTPIRDEGNFNFENDKNQDKIANLPLSRSEMSAGTEKTKGKKMKSTVVGESIKANNEILQYIENRFNTKLHSIKKENEVSIKFDSTDADGSGVVHITPRKDSPATGVGNAHQALTGMIEHLQSRLKVKIIDLRGRKINSDKMKIAIKAIDKYEKENNLVSNKKSAKNDKRIHLLGENAKDLEAAEADICNKLGIDPPALTSDSGKSFLKEKGWNVIEMQEFDDSKAKANHMTSVSVGNGKHAAFPGKNNSFKGKSTAEFPCSQAKKEKMSGDQSGEKIPETGNGTGSVDEQSGRQTESKDRKMVDKDQVGSKGETVRKPDVSSSGIEAGDSHQESRVKVSGGNTEHEREGRNEILQSQNVTGSVQTKEDKNQPTGFIQSVTGSFDSLVYFLNTETYQTEIEEIKLRYKVEILPSPGNKANTLNIKPCEGCLTKSLVNARKDLQALIDSIQGLVKKAALDLSKVLNFDHVPVEKKTERILNFYKGKVAWYTVPSQKYTLLYEDTDKPILHKILKLINSSFGIKQAQSHSTGDQDQPTKVNPDSVGEEDAYTLSKKATVGGNMSDFIFHVCKEELVHLEKTKGVEFVCDGGGDIIIKPAKSNTTCTMQDLDDVYETFVTFVQEYHTKLTSKDVDLANQKVLSTDISKALKDTQSKYGRVLIKETGDRQYRIIGEGDTTKVAMEAFYHSLGVATPQSRNHGKTKYGAYGGIYRNKSADDPVVQTSHAVLEVELGHLSATKVSVRQGDITKEKVDIIVNAAHESLIHGGGGAGAIVKAGGYGIQEESYEIIKRRQGKPLQLSEVVITKAGALPCKLIFHTVGPKWGKLKKEEVTEALYQCCTNLLLKAGELGLDSIAIPAIGTGIYGVPKDLCAKVMLEAVFDYVSNHHKNQLKEIRFIDVKRGTVLRFETVFEETLSKNQVSYTKPGISGADDLHVGKESSVDGDHYGQSGTTFSSSMDDTIAISTGHVQGAVAKYSQADKGNNTRGSSVKDSNSKAKGAIPKATTTSKSTWADPLTSDHKAKDSDCSVCLSQMENPKILRCKHAFCKACIDRSEKSLGPTCPICKQAFGIITGNMPKGKMDSWVSDYTRIPGYHNCGAIIIQYKFPPGTQGPEHPNPGRSYYGDSRTAYLPNNPEGREVLRLLKIAFERRLTFTIGTSVTTGKSDVVVWNDIHHKTTVDGGAQGYGYPDPTYLSRVKEELAAKSVK